MLPQSIYKERAKDGPMKHWLVKSEPYKYSWSDLQKDGWTYWDGVRNYQARNNLRAMRRGDKVLYYHSNEGMEVVGVARVRREAYPDPTSETDRWSVVDIEPIQALKRPVTLQEIKQEPALEDMAMVQQSRLYVMPVIKEHYDIILEKSRK